MIVTNGHKIKTLQKYFRKGDISRNDEQMSFLCPICKPADKNKRKLSVRLSDGWYHCWVCGLAGKSFYSLFKKTFPRAFDDPDLFFVDKREGEIHQPIPIQEDLEIKLPDHCVLLGADDLRDPDINCVAEYLKNRGLSRGDILRWRICAAREGSMKRKAIIPSFDEMGSLNYFVARTIDEKGIKYSNAKRHRTEIIFNEIDIDWRKPVILVEGVFDAMKCPENTIPVLGSSLPKESLLFRKLWQNECKVTVAFDPDLKEKSHRTCELLSKAGLEVSQVWAPDGKDFGCMTKKEVTQVLSSAIPWKKESKIFFKIRNISSGSLL